MFTALAETKMADFDKATHLMFPEDPDVDTQTCPGATGAFNNSFS
jgi:hypothetical protein